MGSSYELEAAWITGYEDLQGHCHQTMPGMSLQFPGKKKKVNKTAAGLSPGEMVLRLVVVTQMFTPKIWEMIQFDEHIFSNGLKPPTSGVRYGLDRIRGFYGRHVKDHLLGEFLTIRNWDKDELKMVTTTWSNEGSSSTVMIPYHPCMVYLLCLHLP